MEQSLKGTTKEKFRRVANFSQIAALLKHFSSIGSCCLHKAYIYSRLYLPQNCRYLFLFITSHYVQVSGFLLICAESPLEGRKPFASHLFSLAGLTAGVRCSHLTQRPSRQKGRWGFTEDIQRQGGSRIVAWGERFTPIMTFHFAVLTKTCPFFFEPRAERCLHWNLGAADRVPQWDRVLK